ncbi:inactive pancreatic lipase-related protein 1-like [Melitaea cinxia]|uniref:inactive pancreatic lipase-related protein 1-like n=1 Tax=Melitaea cinxia TaxID=113334 RepID=UPI001E27084A|nr:inactive pancreatic lipase-related protein 1-like [Melitaea cinxia]
MDKSIFLVVFLIYGHFTINMLSSQASAFGLFEECVVPPLVCPNENITFWLYTRANRDTPHELTVSDPDSIITAPWVENSPVKVLIHGYTGYKDYSPNTEIRPAYMECCDYNIISVDYNKLALEPCYIQAAQNTELVGMCLAQLIDELVQNYGFKLPQFHIIGFSLGGQTAGQVATYLKSGKLDRISGLDPALPLFATINKTRKLDSSDAQFVDVLHTNALAKGKFEASGHADFYPNGGIMQPGCMSTENQTKSSCDHARAPLYYAESIITDIGFYATKCSSWIAYVIGWCSLTSNEEVIYGEYTPKNTTGLYFFSTNSEPPYARGPQNTDRGYF